MTDRECVFSVAAAHPLEYLQLPCAWRSCSVPRSLGLGLRVTLCPPCRWWPPFPFGRQLGVRSPARGRSGRRLGCSCERTALLQGSEEPSRPAVRHIGARAAAIACLSLQRQRSLPWGGPAEQGGAPFPSPSPRQSSATARHGDEACWLLKETGRRHHSREQTSPPPAQLVSCLSLRRNMEAVKAFNSEVCVGTPWGPGGGRAALSVVWGRPRGRGSPLSLEYEWREACALEGFGRGWVGGLLLRLEEP